MITRPLLSGLLWLMCLVSCGQTQDNNHETHQVYSYTYHFQHNGTTDPKKFVQSLLAKPLNERGAEVKTFWNPDVRGFVSQGFFPVQPPNTRFNNYVKPPTFEGIKKIVDENLKQVPNPTPPELIKIPPHVENTIRNIDEKVNRRLNNLNNRLDNLDLGPRGIQGPGGGISNVGLHQNPPQTHVNNGVVTNVRTFEKDLPNGKIFEKIETFAFNPAPVSNNIEGPHQNQQVLNHNQRAFGRAVSYFRKEHRTDVPPINQISADFPENTARNIHQNILHGNLNNRGFNTNNNFNNNNNKNNGHALNNLVRNLNEVRNNLNNGFGTRLSNFQNHNKPFSTHQNNPSIGNHNVINQNRHNNRNFHNAENVNSVHNRNSQNPERQNLNHNRNVHHNQPNQNINNNRFFHQNVNQNNNRNFHDRIVQNVRQHIPNGNDFGTGRGNVNNPAINVINTLNQYSRNNLNNEARRANPTQDHRPNINPFKWDDDNRGWRADHNMDWSRRNPFNSNANQVFTNEGANQGQQNNGHHNNPVDALRSTLEALTGRTFQIPSLNSNGGQDGNYNNFRGGGEERTFGVDRVSEGPNSYQRNQIRRYDRNFSVDSNSGYQFNKRWSTGDLSRLSTTRNARSPTFKKDFIDVFDDEN